MVMLAIVADLVIKNDILLHEIIKHHGEGIYMMNPQER